MGEYIFINPTFTSAINMYMTYKQAGDNPVFSSFPVMVIRALIAIYGELDIINPFRTNNENRMGGFDTNITKFGFSNQSLQNFKESFQKYSEMKQIKQYPNIYFLKIEKHLIDMFCYRKKSVSITEAQIEEFKKLIYLSTNPNPIMQQELKQNVIDTLELDRYFQSKIFETNHDFKILPYKKNTLLPDAYLLLGYTLDTIAQMDENTLNQLNIKILNFFHIEPNEPNQNERLQEAITYYKRYGNALTSGNGYVDMLLLLSVIATIMMTLFAITVKVLG